MKKVYLCILITGFLFATMEVSLKVAGSGMDPFQLTFLRFFIGGIILLPFSVNELKKNKRKISLKDTGYLFLVGVTGITISMTFFQLGVNECNASTASVLICVNPFFTMVFAHFIANEKFNKEKALVCLLGLIGILFMTRLWDIQNGNSLTGIIYMLVAAAFFGLYTCLGKKSTAKLGVFTQCSLSFILGSLTLLAVIVFMGRPVIQGVTDNILLVMYISVFVTGLGYLCFYIAIKNSDASTGSLAFFIKPALAPVFAVIILKDVIMWNTVIGIIFILFASGLNIYFTKRSISRKILEEALEEI